MSSSRGVVGGGVLSLLVMCAGLSYADVPTLNFELWGRTSYGDGYVYGPPYRSSGVAVVDFDSDGDNDFVLPAYRSKPQVMRNLGTSSAFFPGGPRTLDVPAPGASAYLDIFMDFGDVTGDGRPDLAVIVGDTADSRSYLAWYKNDPASPREEPSFVFQSYLAYTSWLESKRLGPVNLADLDNDGDLDLFFVQYVYSDPDESHRLWGIENTGTATSPQWGDLIEMVNLSSLMPPRVELPKGAMDVPNPWLPPQPQVPPGAKVTYDARVYDIQMADWDTDGDLDFLYYDSEDGVDWVLNLGTPNSFSWDTIINRDIKPYAHRTDIGRVFGSFAIHPGPFVPDFYVSVQGNLQTWRYSREDSVYQLVQSNAVALEAGQGPPAFWDFDNDGDLDLFRTGIGVSASSYLLVYPNVGTPYMPIWGPLMVVESAVVSIGSEANDYRQDLMVFKDVDADGSTEFFVQQQNGEIAYFEIQQAPNSWTDPVFAVQTYDMANIVPFAETHEQPRGLALANFNASEDGSLELIAAYASDGGGRLTYSQMDPFFGANPFFWLDPIDLNGVDAMVPIVNPNAIESLAAPDLDKDGRPDLVITIADAPYYGQCSHHYYRNTLFEGSQNFYFDYQGQLISPDKGDLTYSRMIAFADIDADTDDDLFIGHQYYDPFATSMSANRYHYLHFYRNMEDTGLSYYQTRVVSNQEWRFYIGDVLPTYSYILNRSSGGLSHGVYTAGPLSGVVDIIQSIDANPNYRIFIDVLPPVGDAAKAIIVIGGAPDDNLNPTFTELAKSAYVALLLQGLSKGNIRVFSGNVFDADADGAGDVFSPASSPQLRQSIQAWTAGVDRLLLYFIDHGQRDKFRLNAVNYLEAGTLANWLNQLQTGAPDLSVTTVIDTCESGSFLDELAVPDKGRKAGWKRITISSAGVGPTKGLALFDTVRQISFSLPFWEELRIGATYGRAFDTAKIAIEAINPLQRPSIDDNGDGVGNSSSDGFLADVTRPGADFNQPDAGVYIGEVAPSQDVSTASATLWLADVVTNFPVERAGALIVPPTWGLSAASGDDEQPLTGFAWVDLDYNETTGRYENPYNGFTSGGLYRIQYYVSTLGRFFASPRIGFVDRINAADAWEPDNSAARAKWLPVNSTQGHNFHQNGDNDWVRMSPPLHQTVTIAVLSPSRNVMPVVRLYKKSDLDQNANAAPILTVTGTALGKDVVFEHVFTAADVYFVRVSNLNASAFGSGTSYFLLAAVDTGGIIPFTLVASVIESGTETPIEGASVEADGPDGLFTNETTDDGVAQFTSTNGGRFELTVDKAGYQPATMSVLVNNNLEAIDIPLVPDTVTSVDVVLGSTPAGVKARIDSKEYELPQTFVWAQNSSHSISVPSELDGDLVWNRWSDGVTTASRTFDATSSATITALYKGLNQTADIDGNNSVDAVDVQLVINSALGLGTGYTTDIDGNGATDAVDVQLVINAALGLG